MKAFAEGGEPRDRGRGDLGDAARGGGAGCENQSVSEVEVSPSIVTALNVSSTPARSSLRAPRAIAASVKTKASMVPMSGAIMPAPLAMPQMVTAGRRA